jgi:hypothetical protein
MFRDEYNSYTEPMRPPCKTRPWFPLLLLVVVVVAVAHVTGLIKPLAMLALQWTGSDSAGSLWAAGSRLTGSWESDDDPMFRRVCHFEPKGGFYRTGIYTADAGHGMREVVFKITSEERSGRYVEMTECLPGADANYHVRYSIADDGQSLTREYDAPNGAHVSCQYRYLGPPPEDAPRTSRP